MNSTIKILDPLVAKQIAAGEIIDRPASVLKELLENAIDAKANAIDIHLEEAGKRLIKISDDGIGIHQHELELAVTNHATSKISNAEDLMQIATYGFRGEALASIAAVSKLTICSRPKTQNQPWEINVAGKQQNILMMPKAHPAGTTITVADLFFNVPVRKKFLKSERTELLASTEVVKLLGLGQPQCRINFTHHDKKIFALPAVDNDVQLEKRLQKLLGKDFTQHAVKVETQAGDFALTAWFADPNYHRPSQDLQYIFINHRPVRDRVIHHAIKVGYSDLIPHARHPAYLLFLTLPAEQVDVNIHPMKQEVRFLQPRMIHDFVHHAVNQALQKKTYSISTNSTINFAIAEEQQQIHYSITPEKASDNHSSWQFLNIFNENYWLAKNNKQLLLIDIEKALTAWLQQQLKQTPVETKTLLFPQIINIANKKYMEEWIKILSAYGFIFESLTENKFILRAAPEFLSEIQFNQLPLDLLEKKPQEQIAKFLNAIAMQHKKVIYQNPARFMAEIENIAKQHSTDFMQIIFEEI